MTNTLRSRILGTGSALPDRCVSNNELVAMLDKLDIETSDEWITTRSGIRSRHFVDPGTLTSDLAVLAARRAVEASGVDDIDLIVLATSTPDHLGGFPSTACIVQEKLGLASGGAAVDVQAVCTGFVYAMVMADAMIRTGAYRRVLVIGAEVFSDILDFTERRTCVLFGDGAGAVVLGAADEGGLIASKLHADGRQASILKIPGRISKGAIEGRPYLYMEGALVFKLGVKVLVDVVLETLEESHLKITDLDWLVLHQANLRILQAVAKLLGIPMDKVIVKVDQHGNTSAASIPLALDSAVAEGRIRRGQRVLLAAVGGGLTWGAVLLDF